jgi:hypothetical protein
MIIQLVRTQPVAEGCSVSLRCPACRQRATFKPIEDIPDLLNETDRRNGKEFVNYRLGQRQCPNEDCQCHIFFVYDQSSRSIVASYPPERIDFDCADIPASIARSFEEAITCHANRCFTASALLVRKALEELCSDQGAEGANLSQRLGSLKEKVDLPGRLLVGLDDLRLLGNDAAHFEAKTYSKIGEEEASLAIEYTRKVLEYTYQINSLACRLSQLKKRSIP